MSRKDTTPPESAPSDAPGGRAEETAQEREERMNLALDSAGVGTWNWKIPTNSISWDERMHDIFGMKRGTFPGNYEFFAGMLHPNDRERVNAEVTRAVNEDAPYDSQYDVIAPDDGSIRTVRARGKVYRDTNGRAVRMTGVCWDITARRRADEALRESEQRYGRLLDSVTDYVYTVKLQGGHVASTSHGAGCLPVTGFSPEEFQADSWLWHRIIFAMLSTTISRSAS